MKERLWKKLLILAATLCLLYSVTACGGEEISLTLGTTETIDGQVEFTAENVLVSTRIFPPVSGKNPLGWVVEDDQNTYVTVVATIKNLSEAQMDTDTLWVNFCPVFDEEYIDGTVIGILTENDTVLDGDGVIEPGETATVYYLTEVEKAEKEKLTRIEFDFGSSTLTLAIDASKPVAVYEPLTMKEAYEAEGLGTVKPKKIGFTDALEPSNPGYTYDYYVPKTTGDTLLVLTTEVDNTSKKKKSAYRYVNLLVFDGDDGHVGETVADDAYAANITEDEKISSGESRQVYGIMNLPKSIKKQDLEIYAYIGGKYYLCEM